MMHGYGFGSSMFMGGRIFMFIFWLLIGTAIVLIIGEKFMGNRFKSGANTKETPMEILKKRYAMGEITKDQYEEMKEKLRD